MIITACPLIDIVPVEHATMPGRVVVQWNKDSVEDAGLIKVDLLGLRTLSLIHDAVVLIRDHEGTEVDIQALPLDDPRVYDLLCAADTIGAFQVESRAQAQLLPRLKPRRFEDIVISVAIIRPGPIQGNMVHPYLRRRAGEEPVEYLHPALEKPLAETLGVMLYQEQVLKVAMAVAGFSPGEADALRRAMSRARSKEAIESLRLAFVQGAQEQGVETEVAHTIFDQIAGYAGYGFCKSHAASFALIAYATCWLKVYHPAAFYCALANSYPLGFYPLGVVLGDARRHHVSILRPDLHRSQTICTLEPTMPDDSAIRNTQYAIRLGFRFVKGVGEAGGERIETAREAGAFRDLHDFCRRTRLPRRAVERLILVGAMDDWGVPRRKLLWELGKTEIREEGLDLELPPDDIELPTLTRSELVDLEYSYLGLNVGEHVMALYRDRLAAQGVLDSRELASVPDGATVRVAGLQVIRQRPSTAHGIVFVTLESARGLINVVVKPAIYERYRHVWHPEAPPEPVEGPVEGWRGCRLLVVTGVIERRQGVVSVIARHVTGLSVEDNQAGVGGYRRRP
jgi:error-prone DNA polymerase